MGVTASVLVSATGMVVPTTVLLLMSAVVLLVLFA
jgi:hypothetical protein